MSGQPVAILASGMVTGVGLTASATCAAIRCGISNFVETRFVGRGGEWIIGCEVSLAEPWRGRTRLVKMASSAIKECLDSFERIPSGRLPLYLCIAERDRPGRLVDLERDLLTEVQRELGMQFHPESKVIAEGKVSGAMALRLARQWMENRQGEYCLIVGVDSYLVVDTLAAYEQHGRLLTGQNSDGFIPGEGGTAILVGQPKKKGESTLFCLGIGYGEEIATILSKEPMRADGMLTAINNALVDSGLNISDLDFRITDSNGELYWFKEATLAIDRILRNRKELFDIWHPADCVGEIGAAVGPCILGIALHAAQRNYAFGRGPLCHFGSDHGARLAVVLRHQYS